MLEDGWEGEKIVFALLSLTLARRAGEVPGSGSSCDMTGLLLVTSLYDLWINEAIRGELDVIAITKGKADTEGRLTGEAAACSALQLRKRLLPAQHYCTEGLLPAQHCTESFY